jgi:hypothetical protein
MAKPQYIGKSSIDLIRTEGSNTTFTKWWMRTKSISGLAVGDRLLAVCGLFKNSPETTIIAPKGWQLIGNADATRIYTKIATQDDTWPELVALTHPELVSFIFYNPRAGGLQLLGEFCEVYCYRQAPIIDGISALRFTPEPNTPVGPHYLPQVRTRYPDNSVLFGGELAYRFAGSNFGESSIDGMSVRSKDAPQPAGTWSWVVADGFMSSGVTKSPANRLRGWGGNYVEFDSFHLFAITMIANTPPAIPQLQGPDAGVRIDVQNNQPPFSWTYSNEDGTIQGAYQFRRTALTAGGVKTTYEYWNATTSAWQGTAVWNSTASKVLKFPTGRWANGTTYAWSVKVRSAGAAMESPDWSEERTLLADTAPILSISAPDSTVTTTNQPSVVWSVSDPEAQPQQSYQVVVLKQDALADPDFDYQNPAETAPAGTSIWNSGATSGSQQFRTLPTLRNHVAYVVFVRVFNGQYSTWDYQLFTLNLALPTPPVIHAVAE